MRRGRDSFQVDNNVVNKTDNIRKEADFVKKDNE